ncbi:MAG: NfeD family protein [Magnetococcales bacterium]|nr:NfeD family protein [Magnetococcales bacterium]
MDLVSYFDLHREAIWFTIGFTLLGIEAGVFGFATGMLLFAGIGAVGTGLLIFTGLLDGAPTPSMATFATISIIAALLFWKILIRVKRPSVPPPPVSDLVGLRFLLRQDLSVGQSAMERYSGVDWTVVLDPASGVETIRRETMVEVVSLDAGILRVRPAEGSGNSLRP